MTPNRVASLVIKAERSSRAARLLACDGFTEEAASRAYYAMFYGAQALLESKGLAFSSHSAVTAAFGLHFAKTKALPPHLHRYLLESFALRLTSDYDIRDVAAEAAEEVISWADEFLAAARAYLASSHSSPQGDNPST